MSDEARINVATGFNGGTSVSVRADSAQELDALLSQIAEAAATSPGLAALFQPLVGQVNASPVAGQVAVANVQAAMPSTVGQPLPAPPVAQQPPWQPAPVAQPTAQAVAGPPPGVAYPGNCAHGPRVYKDTQARGKQWRRWECAIPWSKGVQGRCDSVNVDA